MVVIIAISAAIAIPAVQSGRHQREVRSTLQHFVAAVREASSKAILTRQTVELWISPDESSYALAVPEKRPQGEEEAEDGETRRDRRRDPRDDREEIEIEEAREIVARVELPKSASFGDVKGGRVLQSEVIAIPFFPTGACGGGEIQFVFERGTSRQNYIITIDPLISSIDLKGES